MSYFRRFRRGPRGVSVASPPRIAMLGAGGRRHGAPVGVPEGEPARFAHALGDLARSTHRLIRYVSLGVVCPESGCRIFWVSFCLSFYYGGL